MITGMITGTPPTHTHAHSGPLLARGVAQPASEAPPLLPVCPGRPGGGRIASMRRPGGAHSSIGPQLAGIASQEQLAAGRQLRRRGMAQPAEARRSPCCSSVPSDLQAPALLLCVGLMMLTVP